MISGSSRLSDAYFCIPAGTCLATVSDFCFKCFLGGLVDASSDGPSSFLFLDVKTNLGAFKLDTSISPQGSGNNWLCGIRPAHNFYEQNIEISRSKDTTSVTALSTCDRHGNRHPMVGPLQFWVLKDIIIGSELLAWPDLLLGLSIGLPFLTIEHIKSPTCYYCSRCSLTFNQPNSLKSHLFLTVCGADQQGNEKQISEARRIKATLPGHTCPFCGRQYARRYSLVIHQRTHTGHKPLVCRVCARRFGDPSNLNKHLRTHGVGMRRGNTGGSEGGLKNPYVCRICENVSARRRDFERHMKRKHGME